MPTNFVQTPTTVSPHVPDPLIKQTTDYTPYMKPFADAGTSILKQQAAEENAKATAAYAQDVLGATEAQQSILGTLEESSIQAQEEYRSALDNTDPEDDAKALRTLQEKLAGFTKAARQTGRDFSAHRLAALKKAIAERPDLIEDFTKMHDLGKKVIEANLQSSLIEQDPLKWFRDLNEKAISQGVPTALLMNTLQATAITANMDAEWKQKEAVGKLHQNDLFRYMGNAATATATRLATMLQANDAALRAGGSVTMLKEAMNGEIRNYIQAAEKKRIELEKQHGAAFDLGEYNRKLSVDIANLNTFVNDVSAGDYAARARMLVDAASLEQQQELHNYLAFFFPNMPELLAKGLAQTQVNEMMKAVPKIHNLITSRMNAGGTLFGVMEAFKGGNPEASSMVAHLRFISGQIEKFYAGKGTLEEQKATLAFLEKLTSNEMPTEQETRNFGPLLHKYWAQDMTDPTYSPQQQELGAYKVAQNSLNTPDQFLDAKVQPGSDIDTAFRKMTPAAKGKIFDETFSLYGQKLNIATGSTEAAESFRKYAIINVDGTISWDQEALKKQPSTAVATPMMTAAGITRVYAQRQPGIPYELSQFAREWNAVVAHAELAFGPRGQLGNDNFQSVLTLLRTRKADDPKKPASSGNNKRMYWDQESQTFKPGEVDMMGEGQQ